MMKSRIGLSCDDPQMQIPELRVVALPRDRLQFLEHPPKFAPTAEVPCEARFKRSVNTALCPDQTWIGVLASGHAVELLLLNRDQSLPAARLGNHAGWQEL